jgi:hypothetical protein
MNFCPLNLGLILFLGICWSGTLSRTVGADDNSVRYKKCRVRRLVEMLHDGENKRIRSGAAYSLKSFRCAETQEALLNALKDPDESVRIAALSSLAEVGDRAVLSILRTVDDSNHVVREQLQRTIVLLEERFPENRSDIRWKNVKGVIELGVLRDGTGHEHTELLTKYLSRHLRLKKGIIVAEPPLTLDKMKEVIARSKAKPLLITGVLSQLRKRTVAGEIYWDAAVSITVIGFPGVSIRALLNNKATISREAHHYSEYHDEIMAERVVEEVMRSVANDIAKKLKEI